MEIPVLIEPIGTRRYRASSGAVNGLSAEGGSRMEALDALRRQIDEKLAAGAEITTLRVSSAENPWLAVAGIFESDPRFDEWQEEIQNYRDEVENDPRAL